MSSPVSPPARDRAAGLDLAGTTGAREASGPRASAAPRPEGTGSTGRTTTRSGQRLSAFIGVALVALMVVPLAMDRYKQPFRSELRELAEPAGRMIVRLNHEIAQQAATLHDYIETRDAQLLVRFRRTEAREAALYDSLAPLVRRAGPASDASFRALRRLDAEWHATVDDVLERAAAGEPVGHLLQGGIYDDVVLATARLHQEIEDAGTLRRERILVAERFERIVMWALAGVALLALVALARLSARVNAHADDAARGHRAALELMEWRARLMRGVSHDLKNPLSAVDGHAQLLEDEIVGPLTPAQRKSVERIRRSVQAMLRLLQDLLELYRAESGQLAMRPRPIDLREVVRESVEDWQSAARASGHALSYADGGALPTAVSDPDRVRQVLGNLLTNAMRHTPRGGRITVSLAPRALARQGGAVGAVAIDVSDTGPGIPVGREEEIFAEFARVAAADRRGAGLGLAISRRIARLLGGDLTVTSAPGEGACFTLWMPLETAAAPAPGTRRAPDEARTLQGG